jgi:hypothetical protein
LISEKSVEQDSISGDIVYEGQKEIFGLECTLKIQEHRSLDENESGFIISLHTDTLELPSLTVTEQQLEKVLESTTIHDLKDNIFDYIIIDDTSIVFQKPPYNLFTTEAKINSIFTYKIDVILE